MAVTGIAKELCDEKHKRVDEQLNRINDHARSIKQLEESAPLQSDINKRLMEQLEELDKRVLTIESRPARRYNQIVNTIAQWATLAILALLAARLGLQ